MDLFTDYKQSMGYVSLALFLGIIGAVLKFGNLLAAKLKGGKTNSSTKMRICESSPVVPNVLQHNCDRKTTHTVVKQSRYCSGNKQKGTKTKNPIPHANNNKNHMSLSESVVKNWLQSDMYCYERNFISSGVEDNSMSCGAVKQEKSFSIAADGSKNLNSCSSNEDLSVTFLKKTNQSKKEIIKRQKRKQKNCSKQVNNNKILPKKDVGDEAKENVKPNAGLRTSSKNILSLRKQCTKAAAFKAVINNSKTSRTPTQEFKTLESLISATSSLSSSSSSITSNTSSISSSASSSPTQSVNSSPSASPTNKRYTEHLKRKSDINPLKQFTKLNMKEQELVQQMKRYVIDPSLLRIYGFPVESVHYEGCVDIYKCLPKHLAEEAVTKDNQRHHCHFYGRKKCDIINESDGLYSYGNGQISCANSLTDSGHVSGDSSPRFTDSDSSETGEEDLIAPLMAFYTPDGVYQIFSDYCNTKEKQCVRCSKIFEVDENGEYLSFDSCTYHWGKLSNVYDGKRYINAYSCCQGEEHSQGCSKHDLHVWNGVVVGLNGPYNGFFHTHHSKTNGQKLTKVYALDCEMSYTGLGLEVTKITVVGFDGSLVYEHFVKPQAEIIDYNTRFSGVSDKDFLPDSNSSIKSLAEVQKDLLNLFDSDTILIGHGLDNDLKALRLVHKTIVDTSVIFSHSTGYPYRRSLKNLTKSFLKRDIQCGDMGHSSYEDSQACLELMLWKIRKDLRHWSFH